MEKKVKKKKPSEVNGVSRPCLFLTAGAKVSASGRLASESAGCEISTEAWRREGAVVAGGVVRSDAV